MLSITLEDGSEVFLGNLEPPAGLTKAWPTYGDVPATPMFPRSQWKDLVGANTGPGDPFLGPVHDQDGIGMCNCSATCSAAERRRLAQGLPYVAFSGGDLYGRICGGQDQGSLLEDGLHESMTNGLAPVEDGAPYLKWQGVPPGPSAARNKGKVLEAWLCPTFDHCFCAVLAGFDLISGVMWYNNYTPAGDGWLPSQGRGGGGGHAVHGYKPTFKDNTYGIWHKNSWKASWGLHGCCVFPEAMYRGPVGGWWAVRVVTDEGGDVPPPPA
jgi:hypothetical protein